MWLSVSKSRRRAGLVVLLTIVMLAVTGSCSKSEPQPTPTPQPAPQSATRPEPFKAAVIRGKVLNNDPSAGPMEGVEIAAILDREAVASAKVNPQTGEYAITVPGPGTYNLRLKTPAGFPVTFSYAVEVKPGQTVTAPEIPLPVGALPTPTPPQPTPSPQPSPTTENAAIEGTVNIPVADVRVIQDGKVVAQGKAVDGKFRVSNVPAGNYEVEFSAGGYATSRVQNVSVPSQGSTSLNAFLLYRSPLDGVDYDKGVVTATGLGKPRPNMPAPQASLLACRAAKIVAYRNLLDTILGLQVERGKSLRDLDANGNIKSQLQGFVSGARVVKQDKRDDGTCDVTLEIPLHGAASVTRFLQTVIK